MKKKRKKPANVYPVKDLESANAALGEIALLKRKIEAVESGMNDAIDKIKLEAEADAAGFYKRLNALENGLQAFAEFGKDELFKTKRSVELVFGEMGFRRSKELKPKPKNTWKKVMGLLKELKFTDAIRIKESPDKEVLRQWPDERLSLVNLRWLKKDLFWYELKEEEITDLSSSDITNS